jgi:endonuclease I
MGAKQEGTKKDLHKDHVIPDGRNDLKNCVPACHSCNSSKGDLSLNTWYNKNNPVYAYDRYIKIYKWIRFDCRKFIRKKQPKRKYAKKNKKCF